MQRLACALLAGALVRVEGVGPEVPTVNGPIRGFNRLVDLELVSVFYGVPFAEPPVGPLRFHYPQPFTSKWTKVRDATTKAPGCTEQEDCLYLNVWTPTKMLSSDATPLAVMFWIYGGGFTKGDGYESLGPLPANDVYDGAPLCSRHDTVVLTHNYRLNTLGLNTWTKGANGETGSQAMADQRMAMKWTHENIRNFGGDPARVTIFGQSAGAFSVIYHLVSQPSWQYFSRAISMSGVSYLSWFFQEKSLVEDLDATWASAVGCPGGPSSAQLACLQELSADAFNAVPDNMTGRSPLFPYFPVGIAIDGTTWGLLDMPSRLVASGRFHRVPTILGAQHDDGSLFEKIMGVVIPNFHASSPNQTDVDTALNWTLGSEGAAQAQERYHVSEYASLGTEAYSKLLMRAVRDLGFQCSDRFLAESMRSFGIEPFVYTMSFDFGLIDQLVQLGDFHASGVIFVFRAALLELAELQPLSSSAYRMSDIVQCTWATFAKTGNPSGVPGEDFPRNCEKIIGSVVPWPAYNEKRQYYSLKVEPEVSQLQSNNTYPDDEFPSDYKCDMWESMTYPWHAKSSPSALLV